MGRDKLWLECNDQTLLSRTIETCRAVFPVVKLVADDVSKFNPLDIDVIPDWPDAEGPLRGVIAALQDCDSDVCFVTAADLFDLDVPTITMLLESWSGEQFVGIREGTRIQALCGLYHKSVFPHLISGARDGNYRIGELVEKRRIRLLDPPCKEWRNINSPDDYKALEAGHD